MWIPSLKDLPEEITVEHCSVLLERLGPLLAGVYGENEMIDIVNHIDPTQMLVDIKLLFTTAAFMSLFQSEFGKGVILGAFVQEFILEGIRATEES